MTQRQTIWMTGSGGFIGTPLARALKESGLEVKCFTNSVAETGDGRKREHDCSHLDYLNAADIKKHVDSWGLPDAFLHLGWGAMANPESPVHLEENVLAGKTLIRTLFELGLPKFVFLGSMNEYGGRAGSLAENMEPEGRLTNYAKGKIQVAEFGLQIAKHLNRTFLHIRSFYVFGTGQRRGSLINDLYQSYKQELDAHLGPCEYYRDYIYVLDVVEGIRRITDLDVSTTVNLGSGKAIKLKDFVTLFWERLGGGKEKLNFGFYPMRAGEPEQPRSYADLTRLKELTHWTPSRSIEEGIDLTIRALGQMSARS